MTPAFSAKFKVAVLKVRLTDLFNYSLILKDAAYGNFTGKVGNSAFHQNTDFDSSADIVVGTNTFADVDLPLSDGKILNGTYTFIENVKIVNEVLYRPGGFDTGYFTVPAPGGNNFTTITLSDPPDPDYFAVDVNLLIDALSDVRVGFYTSGNVLLGSAVISSVSGDTITFPAANITGYATIAKIRIIGTNTYTTTHTYTYSGCPTITPSLQAIPDCYRSQMAITDCTVYPAGSTLTRTLTAQYPTLADGSHVLPTVTTSDASVTLGPNIWTGGYTIDLSSVVSWQQTDALYIEVTVTAQITPTVTCNSGLCALSACIAKFRNKYLAALSNGSKQLLALQTDNIVICAYINGINMAVQCEDTTTAATLTTALSNYMSQGSATDGCDCGCSDTTNTTPTEIFPLFSTPSTDGKVVDYNASLPYPVKQLLIFEGQLFRVLTATSAGESPNSVRGKFKWLGGGINTGNTATNSAGAPSATINKTSGVIQIVGLDPLAFAKFTTITITNTTVSAGSDIEVYLTGCADGVGTIVNKIISNNTISLTVENLNNDGDSLFEFYVWFNNRA